MVAKTAVKKSKKGKPQQPEPEEYEVQELLTRMSDDGKTRLFEVSWKGYKKADTTREPAANLSTGTSRVSGYKGHKKNCVPYM